MLGTLLFIFVALLLLLLGAQGLVRGSASLALRLGIRPLVVGLTVVAFGTSSPELVTSIKASMAGQADIAVGNVIGSNIFNIGVILGISAVICPMAVRVQLVRLDTPVCICASIALWLGLEDGGLSRPEGVACLAALFVYAMLNVYLARREPSQEGMAEFETGLAPVQGSLPRDLMWIICGLVLMLIGSAWLLSHSILLARALGVSDAVIGLTLIAAGTSLPELATSIVAALHGQSDLAIGNVVGSNLFNLLGILGITAVLSPISAPGISPLDLGMLVGTACAVQVLLWTQLRVHRYEGALLLAIYGFYLWCLWPK